MARREGQGAANAGDRREFLGRTQRIIRSDLLRQEVQNTFSVRIGERQGLRIKRIVRSASDDGGHDH